MLVNEAGRQAHTMNVGTKKTLPFVTTAERLTACRASCCAWRTYAL